MVSEYEGEAVFKYVEKLKLEYLEDEGVLERLLDFINQHSKWRICDHFTCQFRSLKKSVHNFANWQFPFEAD